ncbi:floricaula protein [Phtheirospermum japonicum]|uniref:Floricaula/leafy-like transcription factor n=1 Tax=Phtheirospermum japonicum TaxID=374723 RepID=A0A830CXL9_9LAMI|nr:floricaula protein [Phtheirospermum japonicum]
MDSLCHIFRWDLLVGERYGIKAAVRAERRRLVYAGDGSHAHDALSQEGLSFIYKPAQQQEKEVGGSGGGAWDTVAVGGRKQRMMKNINHKGRPRMANSMDDDDDEEGTEVAEDEENNGGATGERQREHPFIVTEPGEVARGKKNGLDYLFHLYEVCHELLVQVQNMARERGEKCPTKVTNQVFRYAKSVGANHINKPKMRHYVHCYALHCLDEAASNSLRRVFKERRENVGAWRQACYMPLVAIAAGHGWDIDAVFNAHSRLSIWYVPTKLRQLCHVERSNATASSSVTGGGSDHLPF